ncbi:protein of unknown function [Burkholderia multivorans]
MQLLPSSHNVRALPGHVAARDDRALAAADDAALARAERNEEIEDDVEFDDIELTPEAKAVISAALRCGRIEDVYEVFNTLVAARNAEVARRIAAADREDAREAARRGFSIVRAEA